MIKKIAVRKRGEKNDEEKATAPMEEKKMEEKKKIKTKDEKKEEEGKKGRFFLKSEQGVSQ
jgi:hypothetical protein